ncbi:MAG TPA: DUF2911 domain-containing protein [Kofleriaceae bacterium]
MRKLLAAPILVLALTSLASAQPALEVPQPSPHARVEQRVGLTDVALDYSSPGVKARKIWGEVVPYDKVWRAGANAPTKLTVSRDFSFGGTAVPAGTYSLFVTPGKAAWTVMLNKNLTASQDQHDAKDDVVTLSIRPLVLPASRERLRYTFDDTKDEGTTLTLEWERMRLAVPIAVDTKGQVLAGIDRATADLGRTPLTAASYLFDVGQTDRALELCDRSIAIQRTWRGEWLRAQILHKKGNKAEAMASVGRAQELGKADPGFETGGKPQIQKTIASWK